MPSLSHRKLHGRAQMLRALSRAGQFAHVPVANLAENLDELYDIEFRLRLGRHAPSEMAVPLALVKARESGWLTEPGYDAKTIDYIAMWEGVCCCLCLRVDRPVGPATPYTIPKGFALFVCPTFLRVEGPERFDDQPPLCLPCRHALGNKLWRDYGIHERPDTEAVWSALLAWLLANRSFRERVEANASKVNELRFDPRRIPARGRRSSKVVCESCGGKRSPKALTCRACFREGASAAAQARWDVRRAAA